MNDRNLVLGLVIIFLIASAFFAIRFSDETRIGERIDTSSQAQGLP